MKKSIGIVAVVLCATLAQARPQEEAQPQASPSAVQMKPDVTSRLVDGLSLTEEQREAVAKIRRKTVEENATFLETSKKTKEDVRTALQTNDTARLAELKLTLQSQREELKRIREAELQKIMEILTPEQRAQFEAQRAALEAQRSGQ